MVTMGDQLVAVFYPSNLLRGHELHLHQHRWYAACSFFFLFFFFFFLQCSTACAMLHFIPNCVQYARTADVVVGAMAHEEHPQPAGIL